jgi:hypothetical protein
LHLDFEIVVIRNFKIDRNFKLTSQCRKSHRLK